MKPIERLLKLLNGYRREIGIILLFAIVGGLIELSLPLGIQSVINLIMGGQVSVSWIVLVFLILLGIAGSGYLQILQMMVGEYMQQSIFSKVAFEFTYRLPRIKPNAANKHFLPELVNRFFDTISLQKGIFKLLFETSKAALQIFFGLLLLAFYNPYFAVYSVGILLLIWLVVRLTGKPGLESGLKESKYKYKLVHWLEEVARTSDTFKLAGITNLTLQRTDADLNLYLKARNKHFRVLITQYGFLILVKAFAAGIMLFAGGMMVMNGELNLGQFVAAEIVIVLMIGALEKLILSADTIFDVLISIEKLGHVTDFPLEKTKDDDENTYSDLKPFAVELCGLSLDFEDNSKSLLQDINLKVEPGQKVALVGYSGCGRTTLLKAVAGFYPVKSGKLLINGSPVPEKDLAKFRLHVGDGLQSLDIFEGTVKDNISLGRPHISNKDVDDVLVETGIRDYMIERNQDFDELLNPAGKGISAGLQTRIILARTFCGNPGLVLLEDEVVPLPANIRSGLLSFVFNPNKQITMIATTNRLDFAKRCDRVVWIDNGHILKSGSPDEVIPLIPSELLF